jgi:HSP20 family protein
MAREMNDMEPKKQRSPEHEADEPQRGLAHRSFALTPGEFFRMSPFSMLRRMSDEMDRMFGEFGSHRGREGSIWSPPIEVTEQDGRYVVRAELPGLNPADVKLEVTDEAVVIQGERKSERDETKGGVHMTERMYGHFHRSIPLPEGAKVDDARARFENGVLEITVPVQEQRTKRREIPIESTRSASGSNKAA